CHSRKVFLLRLFTACCELCCSTCLRSLGGLPACIGVNLCIEYHDVDVLAACKYVVNAAESDIVSPSVTTEYPLGFLSQQVFVLENFVLLGKVAAAAFQSCYKLVCSCSVCSPACECIKVLFRSCLYIFFLCDLSDLLNFCFHSVTDRVLSEQHTITELSVILEQRVAPSRSFAFRCYRVRCGR